MEDAALLAADDRCPDCGHEVANAWLVCAWCGQRLAVPAELPRGARLADDRYEVLRVIGRGGFGITYAAVDHRLERQVAIKELFPESAVRHGSVVLTPPEGRAAFHDARERFLREARVLARFTHPGIVRVYEVFEEHGTAYLVMELLVGRSLVQLLHERGRPFSEDEVLDVAGRVAAALRPVHVAGVLHRDINPANVMLTDHGRIVVIDFGLARDFEPGHTVGMTRMVTPGYAPIEQYRGQARFGPATDIYGLAAACYRLGTGRVPVSALDRSGGAALVGPHVLNPAISKPVSDAIRDGLELEPSHRPQDLDSFLARLGVRQLPDSPRSLLVDALPPAAPVSDAVDASEAVEVSEAVDGSDAVGVSEAVAQQNWRPSASEPLSASEPRTGPTVIVAPRSPGAPVDPGPDATVGRPLAAVGPDHTAPTAAGALPLATVGPDHTSPTAAGWPPPPTEPHLSVRALPPPAIPVEPLPSAASSGRPAGRRKLTWPVAAVTLAWASVAPVLTTGFLIVIVLPLLATIGDSEAQRLRTLHGVAAGRLERRLSPGALAPGRFVANLAMSALRGVLIVAAGALLLGGWFVLRGANAPQVVLDVVLRGAGVLVVGALLVSAREGSARFRTGLGIDSIVQRWLPGGRTTERLVIGWVIAVALLAGALWLDPSPFPLS